MAGRNLRFGLMAGACCAAFGFLVPTASAQAETEPGSPFELAFWQAVSASDDPVLYEAYLKQYPVGTFAAIAHVKVDSLHKPAAPPAAPVAGARLPVPQFGLAPTVTAPAFTASDAARAAKDAAAAQRTAEAVQAAAAAATPPALVASPAPIPVDGTVVTALAAPSAPTAAPTLAFVPSAGDAAQDLFGKAAAMPVGSAALLASLSGEPAAPALPTPPPVMAMAAPVPAAPAPTASPTMLAALGAAPAALPTAEALTTAVAAQATPATPPVRFAATPLPAQPAYAPRQPRYAAAAAYETPPRSRRNGREAQFMRAVVSTAAVSVEMPDAAKQISPLGIMLGQMVHSQETPGTQYGFQEEVAMPMRPRLIAVPEVAVPQSFCSIDQQSAFSEGIYRPALAIAEHNAQVASAYVRKLRTLYDNYQLSGDSTSLQSVAAEARDFARAANAANSIHDALVNPFEDIMTTPVGSCGAIQ